jgi:hypothetical protein
VGRRSAGRWYNPANLPAAPTQPPAGLRRILVVVGVNFLVLLAIEGLASGIAAVRLERGRLRPTVERPHTRYDPELGWVSIPNVSSPAMFGPGSVFRTNSQGFRNEAAFPAAVQPGRVRVVCSGDSFTLGYGVSNPEAWCNHLSAIDPRREPVNMGQVGYGMDQAYLWYRRDGTAIAHDVQLFAFITVDIDRMREARFLTAAKPVLVVEGGRLVTKNVPVPQRSWVGASLASVVRVASSLRTIQLLQSWLPQRAAVPPRATGPDDPLRPVVAALFRSLRDLHRERGSVLVLVYLPMRSDYADNPETGAWRTFVREEAARQDILVVDLVDDLRKVPSTVVDDYFISSGDPSFSSGAGHYSVRGNDFIARSLYDRLMSYDAIAERVHRAGAQSAVR